MNNSAKVGIIGCGTISSIYFQNGKVFDSIDIVACADIVEDQAKRQAAEYGCKAVTVRELLADPQIEIVLNLTVPKAHTEVGLAALEAGKSVYSEKPLATTREDGLKLLALARDKGLRVGCAPDTFLGGGIQTCIKLIDDGWIGRPVGATAFMMCHGHESWHPSPEFYYEVGGGPMFDMGPYYLTALVAMLGPVSRITGCAKTSFPERIITSEPKRGKRITVEVPTFVAGLMDFECGATASIITSFDVWSAQLPLIEIYGSEGTLSVPDPNGFGGPVRIRRAGSSDWAEMPLTHGYAENSRGVGVADMACALRSGRKHRASGDLAYHVLDIVQGFHDSSDQNRHLTLDSKCPRPAPLPMGLTPGTMEE